MLWLILRHDEQIKYPKAIKILLDFNGFLFAQL